MADSAVRWLLLGALLVGRSTSAGLHDSSSSSTQYQQRIYRVVLPGGSAGMSLVTDGSDTRAFVSSVATGSVAAAAGLTVDDELLSVDEQTVYGRASTALHELQAEVQRQGPLERLWEFRRPLRQMQAVAAIATTSADWVADVRANGGVANVIPAQFEQGRGLAVAKSVVEKGEVLVWVPESMALSADDRAQPLLSLATQLLATLDSVSNLGSLRAYHVSSLPLPPPNIPFFSLFARRVVLSLLGSPDALVAAAQCHRHVMSLHSRPEEDARWACSLALSRETGGRSGGYIYPLLDFANLGHAHDNNRVISTNVAPDHIPGVPPLASGRGFVAPRRMYKGEQVLDSCA
jgi:hypothetical protein